VVRRFCLTTLVLLAVVPLLVQHASAGFGQPVSSDPMVQLDQAKLLIGEGKLLAAGEALAAIPHTAEPYVTEEIVYTELLIAGTYLSSAYRLLGDLERGGQGGTGYAQWLRGERTQYAQRFVALANEYLALTADGPALDFVRFRLPWVSDEHLRDMELYADPQILGAAVTNWDEGREGLGRGLVQTQTRVALVLSAAVNYDLPQASRTLAGVAERLKAGVPLDYPTVLDWLADISLQHSPAAPELAGVVAETDARILQLTADQPDSAVRHRAQAREKANTDGQHPS
jgi:hypothetical protein